MTAILWATLAVAGVVCEWALANHRNVDRDADARSSDRMLRVGVAVAIAGPVISVMISGAEPIPGFVAVGAAVGVIGVVLRAWAMRTLGVRYTLTPQRQSVDHTLCRSGPYRWVRHPGYTGLVGQFLGMGVMLSPLAGVIATIPLVIFVMVRIRGEERILDAEFAAEYADYRVAVPARLVPWLV
jgi:protein-S-isoprenylcysteine O-methyltransferase